MMDTTLTAHNANVSEITHIDTGTLTKPSPSVDRWETIQLSEHKGKTEFCIGKICKDICFTRSRCLFNRDYHACINYSDQTTLLVFGLKGCSSFRTSKNHRLYTVRPGDIWLVQTNREKLYRTTPAGQENEMVVIKYASHRLDDAFYDGSNHSELANTKITRLGHQASSYEEITGLINNSLNTACDRLIAESQALALLARWMAPQNKEVFPIHSPAQHKLPEPELTQLQQIVEILTSDLVRPPSLHQLAKQANMSHTKLNRCFKKVYGTTVYSWLRNYRLERARYYLRTDSSITDIAFQCGFSSASHFAHAFKQQYGCSPIEYRENAGNIPMAVSVRRM